MRPKQITLVGGGLVGSLLSVMLSRRGYRVTVFEKRPDLRKVAISAGRSINLALAERGIKALRTAGLMDEVAPLLIPMRGRMLHEPGQTPEFSAYGQRAQEVIYSVSRGLLNQVMLTAAENEPGTRIEFQSECVAVDAARRTISVRDAKGTVASHPFEFLIGTDGAGSIVRDEVVRRAGGQWNLEWLDHDYKELALPPDASGNHRLERNALHIWPRHGFMLIALPNLDGSFTVTLFLNKKGQPGFDQFSSDQAIADFFQRHFPDAVALIPDLVTQFNENPTGNLGTVRATRWWWSEGPGLLLGDAAHAIVPFHGQGMNAGFEDCGEFLRLLNRHADDWKAAAAEFETLRIPNANAIADLALENYSVMRDAVLDPLFQLKKRIGFELERQMPDRFVPQYSMVMFRDIPYHVVRRRGLLQEQFLDRLVSSAGAWEGIDWEQARHWVEEKLPPLSSEPTA